MTSNLNSPFRSLRLGLVLIFTLFLAVASWAVGDGSKDGEMDVVVGGTCGSDVTWQMTDEDKNGSYETLNIGGTGAIAEYADGNAPWYADFHSSITRVNIGDDITTIPPNTFYGMNADIVLTTPALALKFKDAVFAAKIRVPFGNFLFKATETADNKPAYAISSADDLRHLSEAVKAKNSGGGLTFLQTANIDLVNHRFTPIGCADTATFAGTYDGNRYVISGLNVTNRSYAGLFGTVSGDIKNVILMNPRVSGGNSTSGAIIGKLTGNASNSYFYGGNRSNAIGSQSNVAIATNVSAAYTLTVGEYFSVDKLADAPENGFQYDADNDGSPENYYREGLELTLSHDETISEESAYLGYAFSYGLDSQKSDNISENTLTVGSAIDGKTLSVAFLSDGEKHQITYIDADGTTKTAEAIALDGSETKLTADWYFVGKDISYDHALSFNGDVNLILADGTKMKVEPDDVKDIGVLVSGNLAIYGQSDQSGILTVLAKGKNSAGIFGDKGVTINGGNVTASGYTGIYSNGNVTITGGHVRATGIDYGLSGIGKVTISGGNVTATGNKEGIDGDEGITLSWTNPTDYIKASSYYSPKGSIINIAEGKSFTDEDGKVYSGTLNDDQLSAIKGKKLEPCYAVTFDAQNGDDPIMLPATFDENGVAHVTKPENPTRDGFTFEGWFTTKDGNTEFDFSAAITGNTTAYAKWSVPYIDENGKEQILEPGKYTVLTSLTDVSNLGGGWYVVQGEVSYEKTVTFSGDAHLILADGATMTIVTEGKGIEAAGNLTIYGQSKQSDKCGTLEVTSTGDNNGIYSRGNITISGGKVTATSTMGYCIYGGYGVSISGGKVSANDGIRSYGGNIILGWTNSTDFIKASSYYSENGSVSIAEGKSFKDDKDNVYSGTLNDDQIATIAGKTLVPPSFNGKFLSDVNIAVADIPVQKYADGKPVCPSVVVTDGKKTLKAGTDYTFECFNNTDLTSGTLDENAPYVKITGIGDSYAGEIAKSFFIWKNIGDYAAVQVYEDGNGQQHAEIDGAYDGTDAVKIDEDMENVTVKFNRTFTSNSGYATIMLPFDVNANNLTGVRSIIEFDGLVEENGQSAVGMAYVWCNNELGTKREDSGHQDCSQFSGELKAYTPYMIEMESATLGINGGVTLKATVTPEARVDDWVFRGTLAMHEWTSEEMKNTKIWGFAAQQQGDFKIGEFVPFGAGAWIRPFRAFMEYDPDGNNGSSGAPVPKGELGPTVASIDLPETMEVVIVSREGGEEHTTVIGRLNTRTGEIRLNSEGRRTFDLKGRSVGKPKAKGIYLKK